MHGLSKAIGWVCLAAGIFGFVACAWLLIDPSALPQGMADPSFGQPRLRALFGLVASFAIAWFGYRRAVGKTSL